MAGKGQPPAPRDEQRGRGGSTINQATPEFLGKLYDSTKNKAEFMAAVKKGYPVQPVVKSGLNLISVEKIGVPIKRK